MKDVRQPETDPIKLVTKIGKRVRVVTMPRGESRTNQSFKDECDINNIVKKHPQLLSNRHQINAENNVYADLTYLPDLDEALRAVIAAETAFGAIPANTRNRFNHDPKEMIEYLKNPENHEEAIKLGLMTKKPEPTLDPQLEALKEIAKNTNQNTKKANQKSAQNPDQD